MYEKKYQLVSQILRGFVQKNDLRKKCFDVGILRSKNALERRAFSAF